MKRYKQVFLLLWFLLFAEVFTAGVRAQSVSASGEVQGVVVLAPKQNIVQGGGRYGRAAGSRTETRTSADSVLVWIQGNRPSIDDTNQQRVVLDQKDLTFHPSLLVVPQSGTVRILNSDPVYHNVFSLSPVKKFDVGRRPQGKYLDVNFDKAGAVEVFCDIHSNMRATIYVLPDETISWKKVKSGDPFNFSGIEPGRYEVAIYASGYQTNSVQIEVKEDETVNIGTVTLNF